MWYPIVAVGTGADMTAGVDTAGLTTPPAYVPVAGDPLIDSDV